MSVPSLPVSYRRHVSKLVYSLFTSLPAWLPRFTSCNLYLHCQLLDNWANYSFCFGLPKINGSCLDVAHNLNTVATPSLSPLWLHDLEKIWTPMFSSSSLLSFNGLFAPIGETAHERMHLIYIYIYIYIYNFLIQKKAGHKTRHMFCVLLSYIFSQFFLVLSVLPSATLLIQLDSNYF